MLDETLQCLWDRKIKHAWVTSLLLSPLTWTSGTNLCVWKEDFCDARVTSSSLPCSYRWVLNQDSQEAKAELCHRMLPLALFHALCLILSIRTVSSFSASQLNLTWCLLNSRNSSTVLLHRKCFGEVVQKRSGTHCAAVQVRLTPPQRAPLKRETRRRWVAIVTWESGGHWGKWWQRAWRNQSNLRLCHRGTPVPTWLPTAYSSPCLPPPSFSLWRPPAIPAVIRRLARMETTVGLARL